MQAQQIMTQPAVTCGIDDSLNDAARQMWEHDCGAVPIVDAAGSTVAIVTDRDIAMASYTQGKPLGEIPVTAAMATELIYCGPEDSVDAVEALMREKQIRRVPVVDGEGKPLGVLSLGDLARHGATHSKRGRLEHEVTQTLAAICTPRSGGLQANGALDAAPHANA